MQTINTNLPMLQAANDGAEATARLQKAAEKVASGQRINRAGDDAAGLAISERLRADVLAQHVVGRGLTDGISYTQTAEGALQEIHGLLQRGRELAVQAANDTNGAADKAALNAEFLQIIHEITRISNATQTFGRHPLVDHVSGVPALSDVFPVSGTYLDHRPSGLKAIAAIPAGATNITITFDSYPVDDDLQIFTRDGKHLVGTPLSDYVWSSNGINTGNIGASFLTVEHGFSEGAVYDASALNSGPASYIASPANTSRFNGMNLSYGGDPDASSTLDGNNNGSVENGEDTREFFHLDRATEPLLIFSVGVGFYGIQVDYDPLPPPPDEPPGDLELIAETRDLSPSSYIRIPKTPADAASLHLLDENLASESAARNALARLDEAIDRISAYRAMYGEKAQAAESRIRNLGATMENLQAARSRISDADYAKTVAEQIRETLKKDLSARAAVMARLIPQLALEIIQGAQLRDRS